ncbi:glycosyltransferase [Gammaproteobacteria bacterium]|nr:glycosyltransferase [Gammaproteobacteria bacterium]
MKNNTPLVTVVAIVFNHDKFLHTFFDSLVNQKCNFDYEILVHDDASTDNSVNIINEYAAKYPSLFRLILQKENQYSKDIPILPKHIFPECRGKYIALCEGDDYWTDENKLQSQFDIMEANPQYSCATHQTEVIYEDGSPSHVFKKLSKTELDIKDMMHKRYFHTASIFFKSEYIPDLCTMPMVTSEDRAIFLYFAIRGFIYYDPKSMCVYRKNNGGVSTWVSTAMMEKDFIFIDWLKKYAIKYHQAFPARKYRLFMHKCVIQYSFDLTTQKLVHHTLKSMVLSLGTFPPITNCIKAIARGIKYYFIMKKQKTTSK